MLPGLQRHGGGVLRLNLDPPGAPLTLGVAAGMDHGTPSAVSSLRTLFYGVVQSVGSKKAAGCHRPDGTAAVAAEQNLEEPI